MLGVFLSAISLEESIQMAKNNNKTLLMAKEDVFKADETYKDVRGSLLPQFNLQGAYSLSKTYLPDSARPSYGSISYYLDDTTATDNENILAEAMDAMISNMIPSSPQNVGSLALQLKMDQVLFLGGKLVNGIKAVDRFRSVQKLRYSLSGQQVILETTKLFYQAILAGKLADIQAEGLKTAQRHLARVEILNQEGQVSEFDLLRARLEVAKLQPQLLAAQNQYELALAAFRKQIGTDNEDIIPDGEFVLPERLTISLDQALVEGKENRTELELVDINTQIMQIKYNAEKGNFLPNVALNADYSLYTAADELAIQRDDFGNRFSIGIGFQIPLFTGFSNTSKRNYAMHDLIQAKLQQRDTEELIELQIKQDHQKLEHAWQNYAVQQQNIRLAERSLELAQVRYENQVGIQLEVFDAQIMLSTIKLQYYNAIYEVIAAERDFQRSIGNPL
jgi:outer membrane protein TolC